MGGPHLPTPPYPSGWQDGTRPCQSRARAESYSAGVWPGAALLLRPASLSDSHHSYPGRVSLSPAHLARHRHRRFRAETSRVWSRSAFHLHDVDPGRGNSLPTLPVVYEAPVSASGLDLAKLSVRV